MEDEDMEGIKQVYVVHEVDLDFEYDAPRHFDFTREETPAEAREVDRWFASARTYPPSPFAAKLLLRDGISLGNHNISPHCEDGEDSTMVMYTEGDDHQAVHQAVQPSVEDGIRGYRVLPGGVFGILQGEGQPEVTNCRAELYRGSRFRNQSIPDKAKTKARYAVKSRSSTLLRPTASMLAKQNQPSHSIGSRLNMLPGQTNQRIMCTSGTESQAAKRQKIEGGHLFKPVEAKQPVNLIHKAPKKDEIMEKTPYSKLRITIPREPDLETAQRAQRMRPKNNFEMVDSTGTIRRFRARPLNRKILEGPQLPLSQKSTPKLPEFQLFHLKTSERAKQHAHAPSSSLLHHNESDKASRKDDTLSVVQNGNNRTERNCASDTSGPEGSHFFNFKANPLNRKILSSKGDMGVFRNTKRETTVPMEFNFHSGKRAQHDLPIDLFSKLSLKSELQQKNGASSQPMRSPHPPCLPLKGFKENRFSHVPYKHEIEYSLKGKPPNGPQQLIHGKHEAIGQAGSRLSMRSLDVR